jgi:transposase IS66 family protein
VEAHPDDRAVIALVATIDELFVIDAQAQEQNLTVIERDQLRQQKPPPILESIKSQIETAKGQSLPKSALAKACNYTLDLLESVNSLPESFDPGVEHQRRRERHPAGGIGSQTGSTSAARKPDRASQPSSPSSKPAGDSRSLSATIWVPSCRDWVIFQSVESSN